MRVRSTVSSVGVLLVATYTYTIESSGLSVPYGFVLVRVRVFHVQYSFGWRWKCFPFPWPRPFPWPQMPALEVRPQKEPVLHFSRCRVALVLLEYSEAFKSAVENPKSELRKKS